MASTSGQPTAHATANDVDATAGNGSQPAALHQPVVRPDGDREAAATPTRSSSGRDSHEGEKATADSAPAPPPDDDEAAKQEEDAKYQRPRAKIILIMFALGMAVFLAALDVTIITTALPTISEVFHTSSGYTWVGSGYLLANAASTMIWGKISDIFGRKPVLLLANVVFLLGSVLAATSVSITMLIVARVVQGLGGGGLIVLVNICIGDLFSPRRRGAYYGVIGGVWALASSLGPIVGGAFTEKVTWRWCFYINLPLDGLAFFIILIFLDLKTPKTPLVEGLKAIDWLGALFIVGGTIMLLLGLEYGGTEYPWKSATVICLIIFGIIAIGIFALVQLRFSKYPILPPRIFSKRSNVACLGVCACHGFCFIASTYFLPLFFQASRGDSPIRSGLLTLATSMSLSVGSLFTGISIRKTGKYMPQIYGGLFLMTVGFGLLINLDYNSSLAKIIIYQIIAGLGVGPNFQAPLIALQSGISPRDIATATSAFGFVRNLATAISIVVGGAIYQNVVVQKDPSLSGGSAGPGAAIGIANALPPSQRTPVQKAFAEALQPAWIMYTVVSALGLAIAFLIGKNTLSKQHEETKTGLEAQEETRKEMERERADKREAREHKRTSKEAKDLEKGKSEA
ncbi:MAG: hypothetical protein M1828_005381 [Chrysothrix sp. TS-e1954]|nr:MAG: hypothetical protein M1828_005381 [Chrysothrix sp. TS-e1954]